MYLTFAYSLIDIMPSTVDANDLVNEKSIQDDLLEEQTSSVNLKESELTPNSNINFNISSSSSVTGETTGSEITDKD